MGGMAVRDGWFVLDAAGFSIDCGAGRNTLADYTLSILLAHCFCRREGSLHLRAPQARSPSSLRSKYTGTRVLGEER